MRLTNQMRADFVAAVMKDVPRIDYSALVLKKAEAFVAEKMPSTQFDMWENLTLRPLLARSYCNWSMEYLPLLPKGLARLTEQEQKAIMALRGQKDKQDESLNRAKSKIKGIAAGCTTTEALAKQVPELAKYIPVPAKAVKHLPSVTDAISTLMALGWPDAKPAAEGV